MRLGETETRERLAQPRGDHNRGGDRVLALGRDQRPHQLDQLGREKWIEREVVDRDPFAVVHLDLSKSRLLELLDEVTLRQGAGHSAGPGGRVKENLGRQLLVADG
jgi:hypothetical protein